MTEHPHPITLVIWTAIVMSTTAFGFALAAFSIALVALTK